jgi:hypothetical protein
VMGIDVKVSVSWIYSLKPLVMDEEVKAEETGPSLQWCCNHSMTCNVEFLGSWSAFSIQKL